MSGVTGFLTALKDVTASGVRKRPQIEPVNVGHASGLSKLETHNLDDNPLRRK